MTLPGRRVCLWERRSPRGLAEPATFGRSCSTWACCAYARSHSPADDLRGGGRPARRRRVPRRSVGGRAVPPRRRESRDRARSRDGAPARARRRARRDGGGQALSQPAVEGPLRAHARPRARARRAGAADEGGDCASAPPGRRTRRDAHRAHRRDPARGGERQRHRRTPSSRWTRRTTRTTRSSTEEDDEDDEEELTPEQDPGAIRRYRFRHPTASGKTIAAAGFVEAARTLGVLILTHRRLLVSQFTRDLTTEGYGDRFTEAIERGQEPLRDEPADDPDVRVVRAPRRLDQPRRVPARDLRRGAHRARREDVRGDPLLPGARLHRHDGDRAADREAGLRRLPGLGRRPAAAGRRAPRADRAAALPARPAGRRDQLGADRRRRLRPGDPREDPRPPGAEPGGCEPLPRPLRQHAGHRLRRRRRPRVQPRAGVPSRRAQGGGRVRAHAAGQSRRDARRVRARRDQRAHQRAAARGGLELAARDRVHAPRTDGVAPRLPAARRPHHAHAPAQGGGHRRRLRPEGRDAQRARRLAALAARRRLLPRRRARHARPAPPLAAPRPPPADAGAVARAGDAGRAPAHRRDPARVAARRPAASSTTTSSAYWATIAGRQIRFDERAVLRAEAHRRAGEQGRARAVPRRPAPPRTRTAGCA